MTKEHKKNLLLFITRTGMYISTVDEKNVVSFIDGYELGTKHKCDFTHLSKQLLSDKYNVFYSSDGWSGQIARHSKKLSLNWITTFKKVALEIITDEQQGGLDKEMKEILKQRIESLLRKINQLRDINFNENWAEEWSTLCPISSKWFKQLWSDNEWTIIKSIDKHVQASNLFDNKNDGIPKAELIKLKERYERNESTNR